MPIAGVLPVSMGTGDVICVCYYSNCSYKTMCRLLSNPNPNCLTPSSCDVSVSELEMVTLTSDDRPLLMLDSLCSKQWASAPPPLCVTPIGIKPKLKLATLTGDNPNPDPKASGLRFTANIGMPIVNSFKYSM
jgi:hypothetical protein